MSTQSAIATLLKYNTKRVDIADELGLTPSAVTQAIAAHNLTPDEPLTAKHARLDDQYDTIEGKLLTQLERTLPLLMRPGEIANVLTRINAAKRRGGPLKQSNAAPTVLALNLPVAIQNRFVLNSLNQVVSAGAQDLVTIPSAAVSRLAATQPPQLTSTHESPKQASIAAPQDLATELGFD